MLGIESHYTILKNIQFIHLDDLCESHIFLFENSEAKGRYICSSHDTNIYDLARMLQKRYPEYNIQQEFVLFSLTWFQLLDWFFNYQLIEDHNHHIIFRAPSIAVGFNISMLIFIYFASVFQR